MQPDAPTTPGATCPLHPDRAGASICGRCGRYMCEACREGGAAGVCADCLRLTGRGRFPLSREDWSFGRLIGHAWKSFAGEWPELSLGILIVFGLTWGLRSVDMRFELGVASAALPGPMAALLRTAVSFGSNVFFGVLMLGFFRMTGEVLEGGPARIGRVFGGVRRIGQVLLLGFMLFVTGWPAMSLILATAAALADAQGIGDVLGGTVGMLVELGLLAWVGLPLVFAPMELAWNDEVGAIGAIENAWWIARGHRLAILGTGALAAVFAVVGVLALCVGYLPGSALAYTLLFGLYLTLRNGSKVARSESAADEVPERDETPAPE